MNMTSLHAINHLSLAKLAPLDTAISFADFATLVLLHEHDIRRLIRFAIAHHWIFCEPKPSFVAHNATSRVPAENPSIRDALGMLFDESWLNHNVHGLPSSIAFLISAPIWHTLRPSATVVDVGGSRGPVRAFLAQTFPRLRFVVQDLSATTAEIGPANAYTLPEDVKERVTLTEHDFFEPQPVHEADVYLLRFVFHKWSDEYCLKILRALVPAMGPGGKGCGQ